MWEPFDPYLLTLYSLMGSEGLNGILGTLSLALIATVIGEFTISVVFRINRSHLDGLNDKLQKYGDLSQKALEMGDEASYKVLNKQANDMYGRVFFNRFGLSAASLWPVFFALDWIQHRFGPAGIPIPFYSSGVNYVIVFLCCYIAARMIFGRLKRHLPYFKGQHAMLMSYQKRPAEAD